MQIYQNHFHCHFCKNFFDTEALYEQHLHQVHQLRGYTHCQICGEFFESQKLLIEHITSSHFSQKLTCLKCQLFCGSQFQMYQHLINEHNYVYCKYCQQVFSEKTFFEEHFPNCQQTVFRCGFGMCREVQGFQRLSLFVLHLKQEHSINDISTIKKIAKQQSRKMEIQQKEISVEVQDILDYIELDNQKKENRENAQQSFKDSKEFSLHQQLSLDFRKQKVEKNMLINLIKNINSICEKDNLLKKSQNQKTILTQQKQKDSCENLSHIKIHKKKYKQPSQNNRMKKILNRNYFILSKNSVKSSRSKDKKKMRPIQFDDILMEILNVNKRILNKKNIFHLKRDQTIFYLNGRIQHANQNTPFLPPKFTFVKISTDLRCNFQFDRLKKFKEKQNSQKQFLKSQEQAFQTFQCHICQREFFNQLSLAQHFNTHKTKQ